MDSLSSVSPSMVLPPSNLFHPQSRRLHLIPRTPRSVRIPRLTSVSPRLHRRRLKGVYCNIGGGGVRGEDDDESEEVERALHMDGTIPGTSDEFLRQVSSHAYDMRRHLHQSFDSSSYDGTVVLVF